MISQNEIWSLNSFILKDFHFLLFFREWIGSKLYWLICSGKYLDRREFFKSKYFWKDYVSNVWSFEMIEGSGNVIDSRNGNWCEFGLSKWVFGKKTFFGLPQPAGLVQHLQFKRLKEIGTLQIIISSFFVFPYLIRSLIPTSMRQASNRFSLQNEPFIKAHKSATKIRFKVFSLVMNPFAKGIF